MPSALADLKILDFSRVLAGPFATMVLADLGATVTKIEPPAGDETRQWGPPYDQAGDATYFQAVNRWPGPGRWRATATWWWRTSARG
jgi:crotonobetainyl-CoA:carnitine CoA-transferase CaiB-like acyl-CoA transferase